MIPPQRRTPWDRGFDPRSSFTHHAGTHTHRTGVRAPSERIANVRAALAARRRLPALLRGRPLLQTRAREKVRRAAFRRVEAPTVLRPEHSLLPGPQGALSPYFPYFGSFCLRLPRLFPFCCLTHIYFFRTTELAVHARPRKKRREDARAFPPVASFALEQQTTRRSPRAPNREPKLNRSFLPYIGVFFFPLQACT